MGADYTLAPERASMKLNALAYIRRYHADYGTGPSYGEIAAALNSNREKAKRLVKQLANEGKIIRIPGRHRAIRPVDSQNDVLLRLQAEGWKINPKRKVLVQPVTNSSLPVPIELEHIPDVEIGDGIADDGAARD